MSLIGQVFNKALQKNISVYISESGEGYKRLTGAIGATVKSAALSKVRERFEDGSLFREEDMKLMERVTITNMSHQSPGDLSAHYSVQGETSAGDKVKGGHVPEDASNQTVSNNVPSQFDLRLIKSSASPINHYFSTAQGPFYPYHLSDQYLLGS